MRPGWARPTPCSRRPAGPQAAGREVVVGYVEPHGRPETEALLEGLEAIPPRPVEYRGVTLREFDVDAALARRPDLILVDELAHTNAEGCRHAKRWQDVEELLEAGINVWTTLNVQHIESLNDVIGQITGVTVRETVPDRVFDLADDLELVDITPEELIERLRAGQGLPPRPGRAGAAELLPEVEPRRPAGVLAAAGGPPGPHRRGVGPPAAVGRRARGRRRSGCWSASAPARPRPG